jgi:hypothetical protein
MLPVRAVRELDANSFIKLSVAVHSLKAIRTKKSESWRSWQGIGLIGCRHGGNRST